MTESYLMSTIHTSKKYNYLSAFLAFFLWGSWAFYVNTDGVSQTGVISAITQGTYSFIITLLMTHFITFQFNKFSDGIFRIVLPPVITVCITGTILIYIHKMAGTPSILLTVSPALTVALLFSFCTVYKLHLESQLQREKNDQLQ